MTVWPWYVGVLRRYCVRLLGRGRKNGQVGRCRTVGSMLIGLFGRVLSLRRQTLVAKRCGGVSIGSVRVVGTMNVQRRGGVSAMTERLGIAINALAVTIGGLMGGKCVRHVEDRRSQEIILVSLARRKGGTCCRRGSFRRGVMLTMLGNLGIRRARTLAGTLAGLRTFFESCR